MFLNKLLILFTFFILFSCSSKEQKTEVLVEQDLEKQMIEVYTQGVEQLEEGENVLAARKFNEAETIFPQSKWAPQSILMAAYSYYEISYFEDAIYEIDRFILNYSNHKYIAYAHFLRAICFFESVVDEKKDLKPILNAKKEFNFIIENYPNTDFALDSKYKLDLIENILAAKEMYIGRYYLERKKWISAINRFKKVVNEYDTTIYTPEALHRLVEIYYNIGLTDESKKYASVLGYNYLSDIWYKETYKIYNKDYEDPKLKIKKDKKNLLEKFKSLF
tara:strand:+ start:1348 stop:2178 length:831 start_codon:yes stop_codon:yes gene_type:complete